MTEVSDECLTSDTNTSIPNTVCCICLEQKRKQDLTICHCITRAPRIAGGLISAAYIGTVADLGPIPKPRANRAINICHQLSVKACQKHAKAEIRQVTKIVFRRPNHLFIGMVSQQPTKEQQR